MPCEILSIVPSAVGDIDLSPDGTLLAHTRGFGSSDIVLWDLKTKRIARTLRGHTDTVNAVAFLVDGRLASCSSDNTIKFWDPTANQEFQQVSQPLSVYASPIVMAPGADALAFGQQGTTILFFGAVRGITLVGAGNSPGTGTLPGHSGGTTMISYSGDGTRLASYGRDKSIKIWDLAASREVGSYTDTDGNIQALALSPDGRWTATAHETKEVSEFRFNRGPMPSKATPIAVKVRDASTGAIRRRASTASGPKRSTCSRRRKCAMHSTCRKSRPKCSSATAKAGSTPTRPW